MKSGKSHLLNMTVMRNKYPGKCYRCGKLVKIGEGHFERAVGKGYFKFKWRTQHADCAIRGGNYDNKRPI